MVSIKTVHKPWGNELWIADGIRTPYALKRIMFKEGFKSSLQVHEFKFETNYVIQGSGVIQISNNSFDVRKYNKYGDDNESRYRMILDAINDLRNIDVEVGDVVDVKPGQVHRVLAKTDLVLIEASTTELDDVIRLQDDTGRPNGKIDSEHIS
jgi:mannose-6-phosphate isomerase-like protein (cupin superfamily)